MTVVEFEGSGETFEGKVVDVKDDPYSADNYVFIVEKPDGTFEEVVITKANAGELMAQLEAN